MPPIRELFFGVLVLVLLVYGGILWIGGYEQSNNLPMNSTIATNYNSINSASALPGGFFGNFTKLHQTVNGSENGVNQTGSSSSSSLVNSVGLVYGFLTTLPTLIGAIVGFIAVPISALGIPLGYAEVIISIMFGGIIVLAIVSAIFLFPV